MMNENWLNNLKRGDRVIVRQHTMIGDTTYNRKFVEGITPKGFIKVSGFLFDPETGRARGDYKLQLCNPADPEVHARYMNYQIRCFIQQVTWRLRDEPLTYEQAKQIDGIMGWGTRRPEDD